MEKHCTHKNNSSLNLIVFTEPSQLIEIQQHHQFYPDKLALSNDQQLLATSCWALKKVQIWNLENQKLVKELALKKEEKEVSFLYISKDSKSLYYAQTYAKKMIIVELQTKKFKTSEIHFGEYLLNPSISPNEGYFCNIFYGFDTQCSVWAMSSKYVVKKCTISYPVNRQCNTIFTSNENQVITATYSKNKNSGNAIYEIYNLHNQRKIKSLNSIQKGIVCDMAMNNMKNALIAIWYNYPAWIISIINLVTFRIFRTIEINQGRFRKIINSNFIVQMMPSKSPYSYEDPIQIKILDIITCRSCIVSSVILQKESFFVLDDGVVVLNYKNPNDNHLKVMF